MSITCASTTGPPVRCVSRSLIAEEAKKAIDVRIATIQEHDMQSQVEITMNRWFSPQFLACDSPQKLAIKNLILNTSTVDCINCLGAIRSLHYRDRLAQISIPALIMVGGEDTTRPIEASRVPKEQIPDSELVTVPSAGHLANIEQAELFNKSLLKFLQTS